MLTPIHRRRGSAIRQRHGDEERRQIGRSLQAEDGELFFEQVVKRLASIRGPAGGKPSGGWRRRNGYRGRSRILFDCGAGRIKGALVSGIFPGNALRYRAGALKLRGGVEVRTLLAAMELEATARASSLRIKPGLQHGAAIGAARPRDRAHHSRSPRPDLFLPRAIFRWTLFFLFRGIGLHVAPMTILPLQKLPPAEYVDDTPYYQHVIRKPNTRCSKSSGMQRS